MDHKFKSLLQNVATRHVITEIKADPKEQIENLRKLDIVNFFVLGSLNNIKLVLDAGNELKYFNRKFAWHAITQDKGDLKCNCDNATIMFAKPILDNQYQDRNGQIRTGFQLNADPEIAAAFYFDLALHAFIAVKDMMTDGGWPANFQYLSCDDYNGKNKPVRTNLDLKKYIEKDWTENAPPTYGPFLIKENGESQMKFAMSLTAVGIRGSSSDKSIPLGQWDAGFNNPLVLTDAASMTNYTADVVYRISTVIVNSFHLVKMFFSKYFYVFLIARAVHI